MSGEDILESWAFDLPNDRIATRPPDRRSDSRML
ncbi:MAG: S-adenosylmethionine:tRNA-ribosyltransferase-isomerase (queuine synthetase), partial [Myxococcota bacterium]